MRRHFLEKWLKDAYSMEKAAIEILEKQVRRLDDYPQAKMKVQEHLDQSRWHADQMEKCLKDLGTQPSILKNVVGEMSGNLSTMTNTMLEDEVVKNFIADFAFENMEIASYRALIAAAEECGEPGVRDICAKILKQEESMAQWCQDHLSSMTKQFLNNQPAQV